MSQLIRVIKSLAVTDAMLTSTSLAEADHPAWDTGTTFALGARCIVPGLHKVFESLQATNVGKDPSTEPTWWAEVGPTNRWKCFDLSSTTQTQTDTADHYEITPGQAVNAIALVNISGILSVRVRLTDPTWGVVYDQTSDLTPLTSESSWYSWFFEPRIEQTQFVVADIPSYPNATLRVDFTANPSGLVGAFILGSMRSIGIGVNAGLRLGIQDYSRKERNEWGDTVLVRRAYAKRIALGTYIENRYLDNVYTLLSDLRATPCLWIASDAYGATSLFGYFQDFEIGIRYDTHSECTLNLEGLT